MEVLRPGPAPTLAVWFSAARSTRMPEHHHEVLEVNLLLAGSLTYSVAGEFVHARAGDCLFLPPRVRHELTHASSELALWVIELDAALDFAKLGVRPLGAAHVAEPSVDVRRRLARAARKLWLRPEGAALGRATAELHALLQAPFGQREAEVEPTHEAVLRARRLCEARPSDDGAIDELARAAGSSASRLAHLFQEQVGLSPLQYRNFSRVQEFVRRWDGERGTLLEAALAAGFGSYAQFHRVFCQVCGEPPRDHLNWLERTSIDRGRVLGASDTFLGASLGKSASAGQVLAQEFAGAVEPTLHRAR